MIRKGIIVVLTAGAVSVGVQWTLSYRNRPVMIHRGLPWAGHGCYYFSYRGAAAAIYYYCPACRHHRSDHALTCPEKWTRPGGAIDPWPPGKPDLRLGRFSWSFTTFHGSREYALTLPLWFLLVLFVAYPAFAFILGPVRRHRRCKRGRCIKCGYTLTGLPEARCPECGEPT